MKYCKKNDTDIDVQLFQTTKDLPQEWNEFLPDDHFLQAHQLNIYEQSNIPDLSYIYALVSVNKIIVACGYFQVLSIKGNHLDVKKFNSFQSMSWEAFTRFYKPKLLIAGHLFRHDIESFYTIANTPSFDAFQYYSTAINAALKKSCADAALVKDIPEALITYFQHYSPQYLLLRNDISMEMNIHPEWENLLHYEKSLKHKYAQRLRKIRQPWNCLAIKELSTDDVVKNKEAIFHLYKQVSERQQVRLGLLSEDYLPELKKAHGDNLHVWLAFEEDKPVAFFSAWTKEDVFDMFYIGFDYAKNEKLQLYFNILFFSVQQAIIFKKSKLILGRTALEAKARIGCKPKYLSTFLYIKNPVVRNIMFRLQNNISNGEGEWENRHPFK